MFPIAYAIIQTSTFSSRVAFYAHVFTMFSLTISWRLLNRPE